MKLLSLGFAFLLSLSLFAQKELGDGLFAKINTNRGDIIIKLEFEKVPMTVASFVGLAEGKLKYDTIKITKPFFDSLKFHRVIANFMVQGGDPMGNGSGNPGYKFPDEFDSTLTHDRAGTLSMANSGPGTNGSQFFITHKDTPWLNGKHSVFGYVVQGQDVVKTILKDDIIIKVDIIRNGKKAKKFKAHKIFPKMVEAEKAKAAKKLSIRNKTFYDEMVGDYPNALQTETGLMYEITEEGKGSLPIVGAEIAIHYTGFFLDGKKFDSSFDRNSKLVFVIGARRVIKGMDEGVQLCKVGGKIKLIIPEWLAYGKSGRATIPPSSHLIFDIEIFSSTQDQ